MITNTLTTTGPLPCNGTATVFPFDFQVISATHLVVTVEDAVGNKTVLALESDYTVHLEGTSGGSVTTNQTYASGYTVTIKRVVPVLQPTSVRGQKAFHAEIHETAFDRLTMIDQQQAQDLEDAVALLASLQDEAQQLQEQLNSLQQQEVELAQAIADLQATVGPNPEVIRDLQDADTAMLAMISGLQENMALVLDAIAELQAGTGGVSAVDLASYTDAAKGAALAGFGANLTYPSNTVGKALHEAASDAGAAISAADQAIGQVNSMGTTVQQLANQVELLPTFPAASEGKVLGWVSGSLANVDAGSNYDLPAATTTTLGGVIVGDGLAVDETGVLSSTGGGGGSAVVPIGVPETLPDAGTVQLFVAPGFDDRDRKGAFHGMTSASSDLVTITSGDVTAARFAWHMFSDDPLVSWCATSDPASHWVVFETPEPVIFYGYGLMTSDGYPQYMPKAWKIQGSDSSSGPWTDLSVEANYSQRSWLTGVFNTFDVEDTSTAYAFHRFLVTEPEYTGFPAILKMMVSTGTPMLHMRDSSGNVTRVAESMGGVVNGELRLGSPSSYTQFAADGTMTFVGNATVFKDLTGNLLAKDLASASSHVERDLAEGTVFFKTNAVLADYVVFDFQNEHGWKSGSPFKLHLHWEQTSSNRPNWLIQYRLQKQGGAKVTSWTSAAPTGQAFTYSSGTLNQIEVWAGVTPAEGAYSISDILQVRLIRDTANGSGLFSGADPVNASVHTTAFDAHIECDQLGSSTEYTH